MDKKGLSAVVSSVLLIFLVIVLSSIIFAWCKSFVEKSTGESRVDKGACDAIDLNLVATQACFTCLDIEFVNRGNINISSFEFKVVLENDPGSSFTIYSDVAVPAGDFVFENIDFGVDFATVPVKEIRVFPVFGSGKNKVVCRNSDIILTGY